MRHSLKTLLFLSLLMEISGCSFFRSGSNFQPDSIQESVAALPAETINARFGCGRGIGTTIENVGTYINAPHEVERNSCIISSNNQFLAWFQNDGNFVVYRTSRIDRHSALWHTDTDGHPAARLQMRTDGMFLVYDENTRQGLASRPDQPSVRGNYFLILQDNGKLAIFSGVSPGEHTGEVWREHYGLNSTNYCAHLINDFQEVLTRKTIFSDGPVLAYGIAKTFFVEWNSNPQNPKATKYKISPDTCD